MLVQENDLKLLELAGEIQRTLETKRWIYFWCQVVMLVGTGVTYYFQVHRPIQEMYIVYLYPINFLLLLASTIWLLLGGALIVAERVSIVIVPLLTVIHSISFALQPNLLPGATYINTGPYWTFMMCAFVLLMALPLRVALRFIVFLYLTVVGLPWLLNPDALRGVVTPLVRAQATMSTVLIMLVGLAWYRQHFTEQATAALLLRRLVLTDLIAQTDQTQAPVNLNAVDPAFPRSESPAELSPELPSAAPLKVDAN